jgi:hypothetical protein
MDLKKLLHSLNDNEKALLRRYLNREEYEIYRNRLEGKDRETIIKENIEKLARRKSGIIPITEFIETIPLPARIKSALITGVNMGLFYYMDDVKLLYLIRFRNFGYRSFSDLRKIISKSLPGTKYEQHIPVLEKHFELQLYSHRNDF